MAFLSLSFDSLGSEVLPRFFKFNTTLPSGITRFLGTVFSNHSDNNPFCGDSKHVSADKMAETPFEGVSGYIRLFYFTNYY
jgi:hypothetical protein